MNVVPMPRPAWMDDPSMCPVCGRDACEDHLPPKSIDADDLSFVDNAKRRSPALVRLSAVEPERVEWLWPGYLAKGKNTLIAGDPGVGKSMLTLFVAAQLSRGGHWPDGSPAPRGNVLLLCGEDGVADTVRPRLDAHGADPSRIFVLQGAHDAAGTLRPINLARDLDALEQAIVHVQPLIVIIDPVTAHLGRTDSYKDAEVRGLLAPLFALAENYGFALETVAHLAKDAQRAALHRPGGSVAFVAAARLVFAVAADPNDPDRRIIAPLKANLCLPAPSLAFRLPNGRVTFETGVVDLNAESLLRPSTPGERETESDAQVLLRELLADPSAWPLDAKEALAAATANGVHEQTFRRAAKKLGITPKREGFGKAGRWLWHRPDIHDTPAKVDPSLSSLSSVESMPIHSGKDVSLSIDYLKTCTDKNGVRRG